jgi:hypothetical protein
MSATTITRTFKEKSNKPNGLDMPLSYDIVKAYSAELSVRTLFEKVETKEGEGSEVIIILPVN